MCLQSEGDRGGAAENVILSKAKDLEEESGNPFLDTKKPSQAPSSGRLSARLRRLRSPDQRRLPHRGEVLRFHPYEVDPAGCLFHIPHHRPMASPYRAVHQYLHLLPKHIVHRKHYIRGFGKLIADLGGGIEGSGNVLRQAKLAESQNLAGDGKMLGELSGVGLVFAHFPYRSTRAFRTATKPPACNRYR